MKHNRAQFMWAISDGIDPDDSGPPRHRPVLMYRGLIEMDRKVAAYPMFHTREYALRFIKTLRCDGYRPVRVRVLWSDRAMMRLAKQEPAA